MDFMVAIVFFLGWDVSWF